MRILHTSDWHLGHTLRDRDRAFEHETFLSWLGETLETEHIDLLLITGDVFDTANPPATALALWFGFLARVTTRSPGLHIVVIGGNHDSAARLDAPDAVLRALRVRVVGGLKGAVDDAATIDRMIVKVEVGDERVWVAAVPFLRSGDLPGDLGIVDPIAGVRAVYRAVAEQIAHRKSAADAVVVMGHLYAVGGAVSELSERKVLGGNQHALPIDAIVPKGDDGAPIVTAAYVALGHLHLAQSVGGADSVRYAGSPMPLSVDEAHYPHQVVIAEIAGGELVAPRPVRTPRAIEILRLPASGFAFREAVLAEVAALPSAASLEPRLWPYVEVAIAAEGPDPTLARDVVAAFEGRAAWFVRIVPMNAPRADGRSVANQEPPLRTLSQVTPEEIFRMRYAKDHPDQSPSSDVLAAFHELVDAAQQETIASAGIGRRKR